MNSQKPKKRHLIISWLLIALILLASIGIGGLEYLHHREYGHYVSYGLHVDPMNREAYIGIPGQTKMYWPRLTNYTLWPVKLIACDYMTDATEPGTSYPHAVQRWNTTTNSWDTIIEVNGEGYCHPVPLSTVRADLVTKRLWPGKSVEVMEGEATGAREPFQKGDQARFVVFMTTDKNNAWKDAIPSVPFIIQDQVMRDGNSYRVAH